MLAFLGFPLWDATKVRKLAAWYGAEDIGESVGRIASLLHAGKVRRHSEAACRSFLPRVSDRAFRFPHPPIGGRCGSSIYSNK